MSITFREHTLSITTWRKGLAALALEIEEDLNSLCYGKRFGLIIPNVIPDDWSVTTRGYSWAKNDPNKFGIVDDRPLLHAIFNHADLALAVGGPNTDNLMLNHVLMRKLLAQCDSLNEKLALFAFFTAGQPPRVLEFLDHKWANSTRPRTIFCHSETEGKPPSLYLVIQRMKSESLTRKESFMPAKCHPVLTDLLMRYLLLVRPLERDLVYHLMEGEERATAVQLYAEYMWMNSGKRVVGKDMYDSIQSFMVNSCGVRIGAHGYRQLCVEIGRVFLGSEAEMKAEELDVLAAQMGHSAQMARSRYAIEVGHLPAMSSDLLLRYGRISEAWWEVTGFKPDTPPLLPLQSRQPRIDAVSQQKLLQDLLKLLAVLTRKMDDLGTSRVLHFTT